MIRDIVKDPVRLAVKAQECTEIDAQLIEDLKDTLSAHKEHCVGMAANMIGVNLRVIIIEHEGKQLIMINPQLLKTAGAYRSCEEGCLCHRGVRATKRYEQIKISYLNEQMRPKIKTFYGFSAQIIQHELDHCEGILI